VRFLDLPTRDQRAGDTAALQSRERFLAEGRQDRWPRAVRRLSRSIRAVEMDAIGQEQDSARVLPDGFEPFGLGARV